MGESPHGPPDDDPDHDATVVADRTRLSGSGGEGNSVEDPSREVNPEATGTLNAQWVPPAVPRFDPDAVSASPSPSSGPLNTQWVPPVVTHAVTPPAIAKPASPVPSSVPLPTPQVDRPTVMAHPTAPMPTVPSAQPPQSPVPAMATSLGVGVPGGTPVPLVGSLPPDAEYASFGTRLGARLIDLLFVVLVFVPVLVGITAGIAASTGADPVVAALIAVWLDVGLWEAAYYLVGASHGQTIGKRVLGIKVCREDTGGRLGFWKALGRMFASVLSSLALYIGWFAPLWTPRRQTWHDSMTHTVVIRDREARLATPAVVWGLVWTVFSGAAFGGLAVWGINAIEDAGYELQSTSASTYESGYGDDSGYDSEGDVTDSGTGSDDEGVYDGDGDTDPGQQTVDGGNGAALEEGTGDLEWWANDCQEGDMSACDDLYRSSWSGTDLESYAMSCGERREPTWDTSCTDWSVNREEYSSGYSGSSDPSSSSSFSDLSSGSLESIAYDMQPDVDALVGNWVVQLSSTTTLVDNQAGIASMTEAEILDRLNQAEARYSGSTFTPLLVWSGDYNFRFSDMWVVVLDRAFNSYPDALDFCATEGYDRDHCLAKYLDGSSDWDNTTKLLPE